MSESKKRDIIEFEKGDIVRIKPNLTRGTSYNVFCTEKMTLFKGQFAEVLNKCTISDVPRYSLDIDNHEFAWSGDMLEKVRKPKFKKGDKVRIRKDLIEQKDYDNVCFAVSMEEYKGGVAIIKDVFYSKIKPHNPRYNIDLDGCFFTWVEEMFESTDTKEEADVSVRFDKKRKVYFIKLGRTTICTPYYAKAVCNEKDEYNENIGEALAYKRFIDEFGFRED